MSIDKWNMPDLLRLTKAISRLQVLRSMKDDAGTPARTRDPKEPQREAKLSAEQAFSAELAAFFARQDHIAAVVVQAHAPAHALTLKP